VECYDTTLLIHESSGHKTKMWAIPTQIKTNTNIRTTLQQ
jgi:hypothetical protein